MNLKALLERIALQRHMDDPDRPLGLCLKDTVEDYEAGAFTPAFLEYLDKHPDARIILEYADED